MKARRLLIGLMGGYLLGVGILGGMLIDRFLYDHRRAQVLDRYERTLREYHAQRMTLERAVDHGE
jgi:hypothetical protein